MKSPGDQIVPPRFPGRCRGDTGRTRSRPPEQKAEETPTTRNVVCVPRERYSLNDGLPSAQENRQTAASDSGGYQAGRSHPRISGRYERLQRGQLRADWSRSQRPSRSGRPRYQIKEEPGRGLPHILAPRQQRVLGRSQCAQCLFLCSVSFQQRSTCRWEESTFPFSSRTATGFSATGASAISSTSLWPTYEAILALTYWSNSKRPSPMRQGGLDECS